MAEAVAYICQACGGPLAFDPESGKLKCEYCDSLYTTEEAEKAYQEKMRKAQAKGEANDAWVTDGEGMKAYKCTNCSAELLTDANTGVICCPYCGKQTVAPTQFSGAIRPDLIIPFANTKEQAIGKYHEYYNKRMLLPKSFKESNHVSEIQGVYVPFWMFNGTVKIKGKYDASDTENRQDKEITRHYEVRRTGYTRYERVPEDASKRMPDSLMDSIEPFELNELKPFAMSFLPGFLAEKFDVEEKDNLKRAQERIQKTISSMAKSTIKHEKIDTISEEFKFTQDDTEYAMLPVWLLTTEWEGKQYKFAMNGQTGKMIGDLPISTPKFIGLLAVWIVISFFLGYLFGGTFFGIVLALIVGIASGTMMYGSMKPVAKSTSAKEYMKGEFKLTRKEEEFTKEEVRNKAN